MFPLYRHTAAVIRVAIIAALMALGLPMLAAGQVSSGPTTTAFTQELVEQAVVEYFAQHPADKRSIANTLYIVLDSIGPDDESAVDGLAQIIVIAIRKKSDETVQRKEKIHGKPLPELKQRLERHQVQVGELVDLIQKKSTLNEKINVRQFVSRLYAVANHMAGAPREDP